MMMMMMMMMMRRRRRRRRRRAMLAMMKMTEQRPLRCECRKNTVKRHLVEYLWRKLILTKVRTEKHVRDRFRSSPKLLLNVVFDITIEANE
jgi:hypothetical protein